MALPAVFAMWLLLLACGRLMQVIQPRSGSYASRRRVASDEPQGLIWNIWKNARQVRPRPNMPGSLPVPVSGNSCVLPSSIYHLLRPLLCPRRIALLFSHSHHCCQTLFRPLCKHQASFSSISRRTISAQRQQNEILYQPALGHRLRRPQPRGTRQASPDPHGWPDAAAPAFS